MRRIDAALLIILGVSFHILVTPEIGGVPVRASLADIVLGLVLLLLTVRSIASSRSTLPWGLRNSIVWLFAMLVVLVWAYFRTGIYGDSAAVWARMKVIGFVVLIGYFVVAGWIVSIQGQPGAQLVVKGFVAGAWAFAAYGLLMFTANFFFGHPIPWAPRISGLAENPNAYGNLLAAALALQLGSTTGSPLFSRRIEFWGTIVTLLAIYLSASRSAYLGFFLAITGLILLTNFEDRRLLRPVLAGIVLFATVFVVLPAAPCLESKMTRALSGTTNVAGDSEYSCSNRKKVYVLSRDYIDQGVTSRMDLYMQGVKMWWENPWLGAGLGAFWRAQQARGVKTAYVSHNTVLWLASETGIVGLSIFTGGAICAFTILARRARKIALVGGIVGLILVLIGASVGMEVLYQRYLWFFCGMAISLVSSQTSLRLEGGTGARAGQLKEYPY